MQSEYAYTELAAEPYSAGAKQKAAYGTRAYAEAEEKAVRTVCGRRGSPHERTAFLMNVLGKETEFRNALADHLAENYGLTSAKAAAVAAHAASVCGCGSPETVGHAEKDAELTLEYAVFRKYGRRPEKQAGVIR